jgi:N-hydroxyarylamine O-acetyltransferase
MFDLEAYLRRIGHSGPLLPTPDTLQAVCAAQTASVPFENIDPLLGRPPALSIDALQAKLVCQRRGGYCFELNLLLREALLALGFRVSLLAGRVVWRQAAGDAPRPRTHLLLRVDFAEADDGPFIADVGFGGRLLGGSLRLLPELLQDTLAGRERVRMAGDDYSVEAEVPEGWRPRYRFRLEPLLPVDVEPLNWFTATRPDSLFVNNLVMERLAPGMRVSLLNDRLTIAPAGQPPSTRRLVDAGHLARVLDELFDVEPPVAPEALFARLPLGLAGAFVPPSH